MTFLMVLSRKHQVNKAFHKSCNSVCLKDDALKEKYISVLG